MTNYLAGLILKRDKYSGKGYIAGQFPGNVTVDGLPSVRPVEIRLREGNRIIVDRVFSGTDGTYLFKDLDPYTQFDLISRDEPAFVYNDVIVGGVWPWTDDEIILHGLAAPTTFAYSFSRTFELTGGVLPYSISASSVIPAGVTVTLDDRTLSISATSDPGSDLNLVINDSGTVSKTIQINSLL